MKIHYFKCLMAGALLLAGLAGCGGGGGGGGSSTGNTNVSGTASKGIIFPGTVNVYAVNAAGAKGALLAGPLQTDINGKYNAPLGGYSGAIVVEVSGIYTDEATGTIMTIAAAKPLHAVVDKVNGTTDNNRLVAVTPLTEMAWRKASTNGTAPATPAAMASANKLVGDLFKVSDIIGTEPVRPDNASMANATADAQSYTLVLATMSQMSSTASGATAADKLETVIARMETEVEGAETSGSMSTTAISDFNAAMGSVTLSSDFPSTKDRISTMGRKSQTISLSTSGTLPTGTKIYAIQGSITVPLNASFRTENNGKILSELFSLAGVAIGMGGDPTASYLGPQQQVDFTVQLDPTKGIGVGDFATMTYDVAAGATISAADFSIVAGSFSAKDANGADIAGVAVTIK